MICCSEIYGGPGQIAVRVNNCVPLWTTEVYVGIGRAMMDDDGWLFSQIPNILSVYWT